MAFQMIWCVLLFFSNIICVLSTCDDDGLYLIRTSTSTLVLDGDNGVVTIQYFTGYAPQLWKFKKASRPGLFYIMNSSTGTVLDGSQGDGRVTLAPANTSLEQQWFIHSNGRIFNAGKQKNLDVAWAKFVAGNPIYVVTDNGNVAQEFSVKEKKTCPMICSNSPSGTLNVN